MSFLSIKNTKLIKTPKELNAFSKYNLILYVSAGSYEGTIEMVFESSSFLYYKKRIVQAFFCLKKRLKCF